MKQLPINNPSFEYLQHSFAQWLDILGYSPSAVKSYPVRVRELLHHCEAQGVLSLKQLTAGHVDDFVKYLVTRPNQSKGGGLSGNMLNHCITSIHLFSRYLYTTGKLALDLNIKRLQSDAQERVILTPEEVKALYTASYQTRRGAGREYGQRDRAMLAVLYGCGLRKAEATHLNVSDINRDRSTLHVRKGKGRKERLVPISPASMEYITAYLEEGRYWFMEDHNLASWYIKKGQSFEQKANIDQEAFFLNQCGRRLTNGFYRRLTLLLEGAGIDKAVSLHTLRHSIATHLIEAGMDIEDIARFLGHKSLRSTQIYTHIAQNALLAAL